MLSLTFYSALTTLMLNSAVCMAFLDNNATGANVDIAEEIFLGRPLADITSSTTFSSIQYHFQHACDYHMIT